MQKTIDAFWRAAAYCLHPRVIWLSLLPLLVAAVLSVGLAHFYWEGAVAGVRQGLDSWAISQTLLSWLDTVGASGLRAFIAPLIVVVLAVPLLVVLSLLLVATLMMPALVRLVVQRRFAGLEVRHEAPWWTSLSWSLGATLLAVLVMVVSLPLWLIPPFGLVLPPLIWGWLTYRVMAYDALAGHATVQERVTLLQDHRMPLLIMGVISGYLGAAPTALWAVLGAISVVVAPLLIVVSVWVYTLVFAFSSLWFSHYLLAALRDMRAADPTPQLVTLDLA
ncbi:MAG: EI24 domain-containing protein [Aquabacterium sp.]|uniref:EI24 domain-containing protein n=1 Tax=Aquabacterium sp. TaxID=1872578 RepID=UPI002722D898|nr:EI24 domain-containing protein [Aquabacterium sp.]MDO9002744.1 EI24 domain-containing protein [Aquabacterium sp.]